MEGKLQRAGEVIQRQAPAWGQGSYLLHDEPGQDVHDEAPQAGVHGQGLDDGPHEQHGQRALLHELLHHDSQHLRRIHVPLRKTQVGGCEEAESGLSSLLGCSP